MQKNSSQNEAIQKIEGPVILISCPGSGKTTTLIKRIGHMVASGIPPANILMVTFTKAAALEMQQRYQTEFGDLNGVTFGTIHSICFYIIRNKYHYTVDQVVKESEKQEFLRRSLKGSRDINDKNDFIQNLMTEISQVKNSQVNIYSYEPKICQKKYFIKMFQSYETWKLQQNKLDFDDMLVQCREYLETDLAARVFWQKKYQYIMCDEFQDTSKIQSDILYLLAGEQKNICVVGDDDQSIYQFRGASPDMMLNFKASFPECTEIFMNTNYRSAPIIVEKAKKLIDFNIVRFQKETEAARTEEGRVLTKHFENRREQLDHVTQRIKELHDQGTDYEQMAILFRTNRQAKIPSDKLLAAGIPFHSTEVIKDAYTSWIYQDIMAYYRLAQGQGSNEDLLQILNRPTRFLKEEYFENVSFELEEMKQAASTGKEGWKLKKAEEAMETMMAEVQGLKDKKPRELLDIILYEIGYEEYLKSYSIYQKQDLEDYMDVVDSLKEDSAQCETMADWNCYIENYRKRVREQQRKAGQDGVTLSTMHKAKGLEWDAVFVIDCVDGTTPYKKAESPAEMEEERRLFYVAVTRAKLYLELCSFSHKNDDKEYMESRFVQELSGKRDEELENLKVKGAARRKQQEEKQKFMTGIVPDFQPGEAVAHPKFGPGVVTSNDGNTVGIEFDKVGAKNMRLDICRKMMIKK